MTTKKILAPNFSTNRSVEKQTRPKDDLFENSTMTFGEHLEELRHCLVRAIICLGIGLAVGLFFANDVVRYVSTPLKDAISDFKAARDLALLGYDTQEDREKPEYIALHTFLKSNDLVWQVVYDVPEEYQSLTMESIESAAEGSESTAKVNVHDMAQMIKALPDPSTLKPRIQMIKQNEGLSSFKLEEPFMIWVKAGLIVGAVLASPGIFYYLWTFVAAGLHTHERKYVYTYLPLSVGLFVSGVVLAFFLVLQYVLQFLLTFNAGMEVTVEPRLTYYVNFVLLLPLGFGIAFQLPLVMLFLNRIGLIEAESFIASWRIAVLVIFFLSMILTPADVTSMVALAVPLLVLYAVGILMCKFMPRGPGLGSGAYDPA